VGSGRGLTARPWFAAIAIAAFVAAVAIAGFALTGASAERAAARTSRAVAQATAASIDARLQGDAAWLEAAGRSPADVASRADPSRFASRDGVVFGVASEIASRAVPLRVLWAAGDNGRAFAAADLASVPAWRVALDVARDSGHTAIAAARDRAGAWTVLQLRALYANGIVPSDVSARRQHTEGFVVLLEPSASLLPASADDSQHAAIRVLQGSAVLTTVDGAAVAPGSEATATANLGAWTVAAHSTAADSTRYVVLGLGFLLALAVGAVVGAGDKSRRAVAAAAVARANELGLVARIGPLLQQSLDVADLLPLFVVEVSDELALESSAVSLLNPSGELTRAFSLGALSSASTMDASPLVDRVTSVAVGDPIAIPLQRGGRVIGSLTAVATQGLGASQVDALRAACDLFAAALGNAASLREERDLVARLRELDGLKATFLGGVSHELRTMVVAIEGFADLLGTTSAHFDESQRQDFIERIRRNARSLGVLVEDLLDFARLDSAGMSVTLSATNLSDLVPKVVDQMSSILVGRHVAMSVSPDVVATADPAAIERILVNLLSNAAKYTPAGTDVDVELTATGTTALLSVADHGPGIEPAERARVFELFYRVDNASARAARGVGIGLALVRQLTDLLHGTITADETPGGGARFRLEIPLVDLGAADNDAPRHSASSRSHADVQAS